MTANGNLVPEAKRRSVRGWAAFGGGMLIFGAVLVVYWPVFAAGFIWNDSDYVTAPALQSWQGLKRIWFEVGATQQYYPLLHSAFWLEHRCWGESPLGYHVVNVLLHALSACLFALILRRLRIGLPLGPLLGGLLFALHPVAVESVAWVTEQKNTLSTVFYLLSALTYLKWSALKSARLPTVHETLTRSAPFGPRKRFITIDRSWSGTRQRFVIYWLATFFFVLALLSKSVTATLPAALLVVLWWQNGRLSWKRDVVPLLPWFILGAAMGLYTGWVEKTYIGAEGPAFSLTPVERVLVAGRIAWFYWAKTVWPAHLIFIYPRWPVLAGRVGQVLCPLAAIAVLSWLCSRSRGALAAALLFLGALFPLLGFLNVYAFVFSYVADHWQYLALFPAIALAVAGWSRLARRSLTGAALAACGTLAVLGALTRSASRDYHDAESFYRTILRRNPAAWMAHNNLGYVLVLAGRPAEAKNEYEEALRLRPLYPEALSNYGVVLTGEGRLAEAIAQFEKALKLGPDLADTRNDLGIALAKSGRDADAIAQYRLGLRLSPDNADLHHNLALAFLRTGQAAAAAEEYRTVIRLHPSAAAHYDLGIALSEAGQGGAEAKAEWDAALRLDPAFAPAHLRLGSWYRTAGRIPEAIAEDEVALRIDPNSALAHNNLGNALRDAHRDGEAVPQYEEAIRLAPGYADAENNLGAALATLGRLDEAIGHFRTAARLLPKSAAIELNLARTLQAAGRTGEAREHFSAAAALGR